MGKKLNNMTFSLVNIVAEYLKANLEQKFTARQIADWIFATYPEWCREKKDRSQASIIPLKTDVALIQQIVAEIGSQRPRLQKKYPFIKTTEGRPRKYYYSLKTDTEEVGSAEEMVEQQPIQTTTPTSEHSLYPKLSEFLFTEFGVYSKRIDEKRSRNAKGPNGNKWLYPDIVGMEDLSREWHREIKDIVKEYADKKSKLWSFEVKILINRSNVREVFFQAVSNSSWANLGYLVASEVEGNETLKELRMLTSLHGIGFIKLDSENPTESQVLIPARERQDIDWNTANRLADENSDFQTYIKTIRKFYQTGDAMVKDWDFFSE